MSKHHEKIQRYVMDGKTTLNKHIIKINHVKKYINTEQQIMKINHMKKYINTLEKRIIKKIT